MPPSVVYPLPSWDNEPEASAGSGRPGTPSRRRRALHPAVTAIVAILAVAVASAVGVAAVGRSSGATAARLSGRPAATATPGNAGVAAAAPVLDAPLAASDSPTAAAATPSARGTVPAGAASVTATKPPPAKAVPGVTDDDAAAEAAVLTLVNTERATAGCTPVTGDARLTTAARKHSQDMADRDYFDHTTPDGVTFDARITTAGYPWRSAGENIAKGQRTPAAVMQSWMNSPGHRANILNCKFANMGVGLARNGALTPIWTQDFGSQH